MPERVLIVEDEATLRRNLQRFLEQRGHAVDSFESAEEAEKAAVEGDYAVALVDLRLPGRDGLSFAADLSERAPDTAVIMMTSYSSVESVIDALHAGVQDYLIKPVLLKDVATKVDKVCERRRILRENARLRRQLQDQGGEAPVARSRAMAEALAFARQVAASSSTVLIEGESGSGKEVVARTIHACSPRRDAPFVAVNMSAIPEHLVESNLFGHQKGAFTGADAAREGLFRAAASGTLFLDEIGDMPLASQAKLLRVLESKEVYPVGADRAVQVDVRILAATNADLATAVAERRFRSDLYYRLSAIRIVVPPLRQRLEDLPALAHQLLERHARAHGRGALGLDGTALRRLLAYSWPGNVRELSNVMERASLVCAGRLVTVSDLPPEVAGATGAEASDYHEAMAEFERALIASTLERTGGDRREAARLLGVSLATLYRRVDKLGLKAREGGEPPPEEGG